MKKIVGLSLALIMIVGMIGVETFAYFTDNETSSSNQLVAGTLDLKTNGGDGVSQTLYAINMSPGATLGPYTIPLRNAGSLPGDKLDIVFDYEESDGTTNVVPMTANQTAAVIEVTTLTYNSTNLLLGSIILDSNDNGYKDLQDVKNANLTGQSGLAAGATKNFVIAVQLRSETGNDFQSDGIIMTMTFTLNQ